jgi:hypothetical protein
VLEWKSVVREKLGGLPLDPEKRDEIIDELAQQLEAAYHHELAKGADRFQAVRRSMAQFRDWEKLRNDVFQSVKGTQMPVWEQRGTFGPRRPLVWISLALSLGFLLLPAFRKALHIVPFFGEPTAWDSRAFSDAALEKLKNSADQQKYAKALAYVALHSPDQHKAVTAAERAIAIDRQLTWIAASASGTCCGAQDPDARKWIDRLKAWDPNNAFPHLLDAKATLHRRSDAHWSVLIGHKEQVRQELAADPLWRAEMDKAFSALHYDSYVARQFQLDRDVLLERGLDQPYKLLIATASAQLPDLLMLKMYADYLVEVGAAEEAAGHFEDALSIYGRVALFGQKLADGPSTMERMFSMQIRKEGLQKTVALLHRRGREVDAAGAEMALAAALADDPKPDFESGPGSRGYRSGQIIFISGLVLLLVAVVAALWVLWLAILRLKPNLSRRLNWLASHSAWAPALLPICALALLIAFFPYARSIGEFTNAKALWGAYEGMAFGLTSFHPNYILDIWIDHLFWPAISGASVALLGAAVLRWARWRRNPSNPDLSGTNFQA